MIANKTYTLPSNYDPGTMPDAYNAFVQMRDAAELDVHLSALSLILRVAR